MSDVTYVTHDCPNGHENRTPEYAYGVQMETCSECGARWVAPALDEEAIEEVKEQL